MRQPTGNSESFYRCKVTGSSFPADRHTANLIPTISMSIAHKVACLMTIVIVNIKRGVSNVIKTEELLCSCESHPPMSVKSTSPLGVLDDRRPRRAQFTDDW